MFKKNVLIVLCCLMFVFIGLSYGEENKPQCKSVANVNTQMKNGETPLMLAVKNNNIEVVKLLISKGADVNAIDEFGRSALFFAVSKDNIAIAKILINNGADVNIESKLNQTALMLAIDKNNKDMINLLTNGDKNDVETQKTAEK